MEIILFLVWLASKGDDDKSSKGDSTWTERGGGMHMDGDC